MERSRLMITTKLLLALVVCQVPALIGSLFTVSAVNTWYAGIQKPLFAPPGWVIGSVWTILYVLMGISLFIIWINNDKVRKVFDATIMFGIQLFLNALWSVVFFGFQSPIGGLVEIVILWIAILVTIFKFNKISELAGYLLIPYLLWVSFATYLNAVIFLMNR